MTDGARVRARAEHARLLARCRHGFVDAIPVTLQGKVDCALSALVAQRGPAALAELEPKR